MMSKHPDKKIDEIYLFLYIVRMPNRLDLDQLVKECDGIDVQTNEAGTVYEFSNSAGIPSEIFEMLATIRASTVSWANRLLVFNDRELNPADRRELLELVHSPYRDVVPESSGTEE